jgi:hypothetical protein
MRNVKWMPLAALTIGLTACGGKEESSPTDSIPDAAALTLEVTGGAGETAAVSALPAIDAVAAPTDWPVTGDDLAQAQKKIAAVNTAIRSIFDHVAAVALVDGAPWPGTGKWYGPSDRCTVEVAPGASCPDGATATFRLWVGKAPGRGGAFVLQAKAVGTADDTYKTVLAGWMRRGVLARRGVGQIWINLESLKLAASAYPGQGYLYGGFAAVGIPMVKAETLVLVGFTPDVNNADWPPATVAFRGFKNAAGTARVRVAAIKNFVTTTADTELGLAHVVYNPDLGGRAFALVTDYVDAGVTHGDVPADHYFFGRSCYAPHTPTAPVFKEWFLCPTSQGPVACALDAGNPREVVTGTSWATDCAVADEPAEFGPPGSAPGVDPATLPGQLPGEDGTGLTPEDPPAGDAGAPAPS